MSASTSRRRRIGLVFCVAAGSLALGAIASPATGAPPTPTAQLGAAGIQPRAGGSFDDTYAYIGKVLVEGGVNASNPASVAIDDTIYVADSWSGHVAAVAPGKVSGSADASVAVTTGTNGNQDQGLFGIAVDTNDDTVYVVNRDYDPKTLWAINGRTMTVIDSVQLNCSGTGHNSYTYRSIAVNSTDDTVYVPCDGLSGADNTKGVLVAVSGKNLDDSIQIMNPATHYYSGIAVHPVTGKVYVALWDDVSGSVQVRNGATLALETTIAAVSRPSEVSISDDTLYVASSNSTDLLARNLTSNTSTILTVGTANANAVEEFADANLVFVGGNWSAFLRALDASSGTNRFYANVGIASIEISTSGVVYTGSNGWSGYGGLMIYAKVPDVPAPPDDTAGIEEVSLSWSAPGSSIALAEYKATASPGGAFCTATPPSTSCSVTGLTAGTSYTFTLRARNAAGWSSPSTASAPVIPKAYPGAPTAVTGASGVLRATVSWTAPVNSGYPTTITDYRVTANPGGAQCTTSGAPAGTSCSVTGLNAGTAYTFTVEAKNATGWGPASAPSNAVTPIPPAPVANMQLTVASSPARFEKAGDVLAITATVLNSGTDELDLVQVKTGSIPLTCTPPSPVPYVMPGSSVVCKGNYTVTEADADASVINDRVTATARSAYSGSPLSATAVLEVKGPPPPERLQLRVIMNSNPSSFTRKGEKLTLSGLVTNTGNVAVRDVLITGSPVDLVCTPSSPVRSLPVRGTMRCAGTYEVTKADMSAGAIRGLVRATGSSASGARIASTGAVEVSRTSPEKPSLRVSMTSTPDTFRKAGQSLQFAATVANRGDVRLVNVTVSSSPVRLKCSPPSPIAEIEVDTSVTCSGTYSVTDADVKAGVIRATVRATGASASGSETSDDVAIRVRLNTAPRVNAPPQAQRALRGSGL